MDNIVYAPKRIQCSSYSTIYEPHGIVYGPYKICMAHVGSYNGYEICLCREREGVVSVDEDDFGEPLGSPRAGPPKKRGDLSPTGKSDGGETYISTVVIPGDDIIPPRKKENLF